MDVTVLLTALLTAVPGLVAALVVLLLYRGFVLFRSNPIEDIPWESIVSVPRDTLAKDRPGPLTRLVGRFVPLLRSALPRPVLVWLQRQIDLAGRPDGMTLDAVLNRLLVWFTMVLPLALLLIRDGQALAAIMAFLAALLVPLGRLVATARTRRDRIDKDLPDFMDVVAVTVSAGIGFRQALGTVSQRFGGPLAEEMQTTLYQIDNGASVRSAFTSLKQRTDSEPVDEFVSAYLQAEELGAPLVQTLTQIADDMRRGTFQRMRQQASKVAPRVTLVTTVLMVPGAMILLLVGLVIGSNIDFGALLALGG